MPLCDFSRILDGRPCSSLCGRPRRESQEASCNFDKASKKDVTLRRRGDDENGNDSNPTKIMHESVVCAIVYADDLAEKVKMRVATLTRQARRM